MNLAHAEAFMALLRDNPNLTVFPVEDGEPGTLQGMVPPGMSPPYAAVHIAGGPAVGETKDHTSSRMVQYAYVHCAAQSRTGCLAVADEVDASVLDVRPVIAGRSSFPIRFEDSRAPGLDETVTPPVWSTVRVYRQESIPG